MIKLNDVSFKYNEESTLKNVTMHVKEGEFVALCGASGCGKTTVTRLINGLIPHFYKGELEGEVIVDQKAVKDEMLPSLSGTTGSMFQNPKSQFFNMDTTGELAFGCENLMYSKDEIAGSISRVTDKLLLENLMDRNIFDLSGGEKQQIALGSICATNPSIYVLDEPTSNMDVKAIERLKDMLIELKKMGKTIIISEHRLYFLMDLADRFLYFDQGELKKEYSREEFRKLQNEELFSLGLRHAKLEHICCDMPKCSCCDNALSIKDIVYKRKKKIILDIPDLNLPRHSVVAIIGENGAGKSTFAEVVTGLLKAKGKVEFGDQVFRPRERVRKSYMVMQDVNRQLFSNTVESELHLGLKNKPESKSLLEDMRLDMVTDKHPMSLSGGQKQRVAICSAVLAGKETMVYDEPTSGLDYKGMKSFCQVVKDNQENHAVTVIITHDLELILGCCTHVLHLENGRKEDFYQLEDEGVRKVKEFFRVN